MRWTWLLPGLLVLCGCDEPDTKAAPSATPTPKDGLSIDDGHVQTRATLALGTKGETSWRITLATDAVSCEELARTYPGRPEKAPGTRVDFWLRRAMNPDGTFGDWSVRSSYITDGRGGRGMTTRGAMLESVAESKDMVKVTGLDLASSDGTRMVVYTGPVLAHKCERVAPEGQGEVQEELKVTIAGKPYPVRGATIRPVGKRHHLRLTRAPHGCDSVFTEGFDTYVDIALEGDPPKLAFASLQGDAFPDSPSGSKGKESFAVSAEESLDGRSPIDVELKGKLDLTGFAFTVEGKVNALRCQPKGQAQPMEQGADAGAEDAGTEDAGTDDAGAQSEPNAK
jgi:hypothetical protein